MQLHSASTPAVSLAYPRHTHTHVCRHAYATPSTSSLHFCTTFFKPHSHTGGLCGSTLTCSLSVCWSTYLLRSPSTTQLFSGQDWPVTGSTVSHLRGSIAPPRPGLHATTCTGSPHHHTQCQGLIHYMPIIQQSLPMTTSDTFSATTTVALWQV